MHVAKLSFGPYDNNVYVIECARTHQALIVDASAPPERLQKEIQDMKVAGILMTHGHPDHWVYIDDLNERFGGSVFVHPGGHSYGDVTPLSEGDLQVGGLKMDVLHTPGHTSDSMCLVVDGFLFSGDALFPAGPGKTHDPGGFDQTMASLDRLFALPDSTRVCPGHGLDTTIGRERPYLETWRARGW